MIIARLSPDLRTAFLKDYFRKAQIEAKRANRIMVLFPTVTGRRTYVTPEGTFYCSYPFADWSRMQSAQLLDIAAEHRSKAANPDLPVGGPLGFVDYTPLSVRRGWSKEASRKVLKAARGCRHWASGAEGQYPDPRLP